MQPRPLSPTDTCSFTNCNFQQPAARGTILTLAAPPLARPVSICVWSTPSPIETPISTLHFEVVVTMSESDKYDVLEKIGMHFRLGTCFYSR